MAGETVAHLSRHRIRMTMILLSVLAIIPSAVAEPNLMRSRNKIKSATADKDFQGAFQSNEAINSNPVPQHIMEGISVQQQREHESLEVQQNGNYDQSVLPTTFPSESQSSAATSSSLPTAITPTLSALSSTTTPDNTSRTSARTPSVERAETSAGIVNQKTVVEQQNIVKGALVRNLVIDPLPLINRPQQDALSSSFGQRTGRQNSINTGSSSSSLHQSSSNSSVNNLEVDEKHFLNEIVKHFNKSIVRTSFEYSSSSPGKGETFASTKQSPWRDNSLTPAESNTVSTINSNPPLLQVRTPSGGTSSSGSSRNAVPKTHYHKSDSAMLNYLFDSHVKLRHSDLRFGPHFVGTDGIQLLNSSSIVGGVGLLGCKISQLQDKTVSWVRRLVDTNQMLLLTVAMNTYSSDERFRVDFQFPDDWRLRIDNVTKEDEGTYECMISTHPPQAIQTNFYVTSPEVLIVDEQGLPLYEKFYNLDSLLELDCVVNHIAMSTSVVHWHHNNVSLNYDATRGGISVGTNLTEDAANSTLWVARVKPADSGNYTCSVGPHVSFTTAVHVLNESLAELHHSRGLRISPWASAWIGALGVIIITTQLIAISRAQLLDMTIAGEIHIR